MKSHTFLKTSLHPIIVVNQYMMRAYLILGLDKVDSSTFCALFFWNFSYHFMCNFQDEFPLEFEFLFLTFSPYYISVMKNWKIVLILKLKTCHMEVGKDLENKIGIRESSTHFAIIHKTNQLWEKEGKFVTGIEEQRRPEIYRAASVRWILQKHFKSKRDLL